MKVDTTPESVITSPGVVVSSFQSQTKLLLLEKYVAQHKAATELLESNTPQKINLSSS